MAKGGSAASSLKQLAQASSQAARTAKADLAQETDQLRELAAEAKRQRDLERESVRIRSAQQRDAAGAARQRIAAERQASAAAAKSATDEQKAQQRALRAFADAQKQREQAARRINAQGRADQEANDQAQLKAIQEAADARLRVEQQTVQLSRAAARERAQRPATVDEKAEARVNALIERRLVAQAELARLKSLGREDLITDQLRRQAGEVEKTASAANKLLFTFRRLIGVLALFTIARELLAGFRNLIGSGVRFNETLKQAEISIAGLITGLADVRNEQGNSLDLAQEYVRAQVEARRQINLLRQDALRTTATFEQLLQTFQTAIGPGFAAGLNLDQIRKLSVSISQAATAIGVPQNQLAEEIRSLVQGTIQARTTRIATVLQITNADVKRLRETGQLFDFLEKKFQGLQLASEKAARGTLEGIGNLVRNAVGTILGEAAQPLFDELLNLGNEVFDKVLTIRDAAGEIKPRPEAVAAFRALFEGLREGVVTARELGKELGFEGLRDLLGTLGTGLGAGLQAALGFANEFLTALKAIISAVRGVGEALGIVQGAVGEVSNRVGGLIADFLILKQLLNFAGLGSLKQLPDTFRKLGESARLIGRALQTDIGGALAKGGIIGVGLAGVAKGFQEILDTIFDVNLSLADTAKLLSIGIQSQLSSIVTQGLAGLTTVAEKLKLAFTSDDQARDFVKQRAKLFRDALFAGEKEDQAALDSLISDIVNRRRREQGIIPPTAGAADPAAAARAARFAEIISNVESVAAKANTALGELDQELFKIGQEFDRVGKRANLEGLGRQVADVFGEAGVEGAVKLKEVTDALTNSIKLRDEAVKTLGTSQERLRQIEAAAAQPADKRQAALDQLKLTPEEGRLVSLLRDEAILRDKISQVEGESLLIAKTRAAILATEQIPALKRQNTELATQLAAEQSITQVVTQRLGARQLAVVQAQNELAAARQAAQAEHDRLAAQIAELRARAAPATGLDSAEERTRDKARVAAINDAANALQQQLVLEDAIAAAKQKQLEFAAEQARLAAEGSFSAGVRAGFEQLANDLPNLFDAAKNIVVDITNQFVSAAGQIFRSLFDPRSTQTIGEAVGELGLSIAQTIFQNVVGSIIQSLISSLITTTAATTSAEVSTTLTTESIKDTGAAIRNAEAIATAETVAAILAIGGAVQGGIVPGVGFARGGAVPPALPSVVFARARGYARGGSARDPRDTVPAMLQPGEFVIRKSVVDSLGAGFFSAVNSGGMAVPRVGTPAGFAAGGAVTRKDAARPAGDAQPMLVPVQVAGEREYEKLQAGGKNALLRFLRENRGTVNGILER